MKALSLTQPWATLVARGYKRIETRSWSTSYRGPLAIHAAKARPAWAKALAEDLEERSGAEYGFELPHEFPHGAVIAICRLVAVERTELALLGRLVTAQERDFGDFSPGRFAWHLRDAVALPEPTPARGALGLWEWDEAAATTHAGVRQGEMALGVVDADRWKA